MKQALYKTIVKHPALRMSLSLFFLAGALCTPCLSAAQDAFSFNDDLSSILLAPTLEKQGLWPEHDFSSSSLETDNPLFKPLFNSKREASPGFLDNIQERYLTIRTGKKEKITAVYQNGAYGFAYVENW